MSGPPDSREFPETSDPGGRTGERTTALRMPRRADDPCRNVRVGNGEMEMPSPAPRGELSLSGDGEGWRNDASRPTESNYRAACREDRREGRAHSVVALS